jgi:hypothetical protein
MRVGENRTHGVREGGLSQSRRMGDRQSPAPSLLPNGRMYPPAPSRVAALAGGTSDSPA